MNRLPAAIYYMPDADWNPIPTDDHLKWGEWFATADRRIAFTEVAEVEISTVFLGIPHGPSRLDEELTYDYFFETMVFGPDAVLQALRDATTDDITSLFAKFFGMTDIQQRYKTVAEARDGHQQMVRFVEQVLAARN